MRTGTLRSVLFWCLPTYVAVGITAALASTRFGTSLPFHSQLLLSEIWMAVALVLPIPTIVAAVKAAALRFVAADNQACVWRPVLGWGLVIVAFVLNVLCYRVIADTLR